MLISYKAIHHLQITIPINTENEARDFYIRILGLKEIDKPEALKRRGGFWLKAGSIEIHIGVEDNIVKSKRHPAFEIEDLENVKAYLLKKGVKISEEAKIPGINRFSINDPFGNRIEFLTLID